MRARADRAPPPRPSGPGSTVSAVDAAVTDEVPRWDVSTVFPSLASRELASAQERFVASVTRLRALYDERQVHPGPAPGADPRAADDNELGARPAGPSAADVEALDDILAATNDALTQGRALSAYVESFVSTDARDDTAARMRSELQGAQAPMEALSARFEGWVASLGAERLIEGSPAAAEHAYPLRRAESSGAHRMAETAEDLFAELSITGAKAWARLHGDITSRLHSTMTQPDGTQESLPVTMLRGRATHPDARSREAAYHAELAAWEQAAAPLAAALNAIKGETNAVNRRRGWHDALAPALFANGVDPQTLEAMHEATQAAFPDFRRYLHAKAALLGHDGALPWWDLLAPVGHIGEPVTWSAATKAVTDVFGAFSAPLGGLAQRAFDDQWVDAAPRDGKVGGAFCMSVRDDESRVLLNFDHSWDGVQTLAHELGHAYHNATLAPRSPLQRQTPMALAETASIFCETLMTASGLRSAEGSRRLALLDIDLAGSCQVVVDIHSRFLFERELCRRRERATLGVTELCALMTDAQARTYGDGIEAATAHPYMWAVKPHYYGRPFYNWPYTFGLLFGIGLHARYQSGPAAFRDGYDDLLSSTGLASAADLAASFGIDVRSVQFWTESLDVIRARIDEFVELASA